VTCKPLQRADDRVAALNSDDGGGRGFATAVRFEYG